MWDQRLHKLNQEKINYFQQNVNKCIVHTFTGSDTDPRLNSQTYSPLTTGNSFANTIEPYLMAIFTEIAGQNDRHNYLKDGIYELKTPASKHSQKPKGNCWKIKRSKTRINKIHKKLANACVYQIQNSSTNRFKLIFHSELSTGFF